MKVDSAILGGGGLGAYMADHLFSEDDSSIVTTSHFSLCDVDPEESGLSLFGGVDSGDGKGDYNWDNCFGSLEDVDTLLSSDPDSAFGRATSSPATLQWDDSSSPLDLQSESELSGTKSSSVIVAGPVGNGKVDFFESKLEFVPVNTSLPVSCGGTDHNATFQEAEFQAPTSFDSRSHNSHVQAEQQSDPQSGGQVNSSDYLDEEKMMELLTVSLPTSESTDNPSIGKDVTNDDSGPSSVSVSDSKKVKMAQAHRARRHAVNRKRFEERTKRQFNHRKILQAGPYGGPQLPQVLHPMPMHIPAQTAPLHQPSTPNMHGYPVNPPTLLPLQPMIRSVPPYVHVGYSPPLHVIPQVAPSSVSGPMQGQGLYLGYQQPCAFPQPLPPYQQHQLRPPGEVQVLPQPSTPTMTPQEKIEKLKFLQQMQARFAVEQQQQQFAAQGIAPLDTSGLRKGVAPVPQNSAAKEMDVDVKPSEIKLPVSDSDFEPSLSVGQTSVEVTSDDEGGSLEAAVLDQLQNTIKTQLELGTRLCIRDALYRLARSAMRRQASSGRSSGGDGANCSQVSQDADATSSGLEASISSDPSSSSRVSRMYMNGGETQTNPIDRSIAHLLFHKMQPQPNPVQVAPSIDGSRVGPPHSSSLAEQVNGHTAWNQGGVPQDNWAAPTAQLNVVEVMQPGIVPSGDMNSAPSLPPPKVLMVPVPVSRLQDGSGLRTIDTTEQQSGVSSEAVRESPLGGHLQSNVAGAGSMSGGLPSSIGSQLRNGADGEQRVSLAQNLTSSSQKEPSKMRNGVQRKRLQHAIGLKELSQVLAEDLDTRSALSCKEESGLAQSGPPVSTSSGSNECQAGVFSKLTNDLRDEELPMDESS